jgi:hypothetical protein
MLRIYQMIDLRIYAALPVAPVMEQGKKKQRLNLPKGEWFDYGTESPPPAWTPKAP